MKLKHRWSPLHFASTEIEVYWYFHPEHFLMWSCHVKLYEIDCIKMLRGNEEVD